MIIKMYLGAKKCRNVSGNKRQKNIKDHSWEGSMASTPIKQNKSTKEDMSLFEEVWTMLGWDKCPKKNH